jgi:hypothetical protein
MRSPSATVTARQNAKADARRTENAIRLAQLVELAPNASQKDLAFIAIHCGTVPTFPTLLRILSTR